MLKAVLWDMGGPIDQEIEYERLIDEDMQRALTEAGITWSEAGFREAGRWAVDSYASNAYKAMVWKLSSFRVELAEQVYAQVAAGSDRRHTIRGGIELREGIDELVRSLHRGGTWLGLVTNNEPARVRPTWHATTLTSASCSLRLATLRYGSPTPRSFSTRLQRST